LGEFRFSSSESVQHQTEAVETYLLFHLSFHGIVKLFVKEIKLPYHSRLAGVSTAGHHYLLFFLIHTSPTNVSCVEGTHFYIYYYKGALLLIMLLSFDYIANSL
jgi:hypothetical protein